jgi:hypothetical protein
MITIRNEVNISPVSTAYLLDGAIIRNKANIYKLIHAMGKMKKMNLTIQNSWHLSGALS